VVSVIVSEDDFVDTGEVKSIRPTRLTFLGSFTDHFDGLLTSRPSDFAPTGLTLREIRTQMPVSGQLPD